jgi:hypothetical protein
MHIPNNVISLWIRNISLAFMAGCIGGLIFALLLGLSNLVGLSNLLGVGFKARLTPLWIYTNIVYGGIWGLLFLIPWLSKWPLLKGFLFSLIPTLLIFFLLMPLLSGFFNTHFSQQTYWFIFVVNAIAGICAGVWIMLAERQ